MNSISIDSESYPVQPTANGGLVFHCSQDSLSYNVGALSSAAVSSSSAPTITPRTSGADSYTLQNEYLTAIVSAGANWGISCIQDSSGPLLAKSKVGKDLVFYNDGGNIYQFGNEIPNCCFQVEAFDATLEPAAVLEPLQSASSSPVRVRLRTVVQMQGISYTREYCLAAGEPFLRMITTGSAPNEYSVMTAFPLAPPVTSIVHGTPSHWTSQQPHPFWNPPIFRPTHNFVLPYANGTLLAPIYHGDVPAWGFDEAGVLLGCLLRNTPAGGRGASGSDSGVHTLKYALRSPSGLGSPATGQPLAEAMSYTTPAMAALVPSSPKAILPSVGLIATVSEPGFILAAKPGDVTSGTLILRLYQPTNSPQTLTVTLGRGTPASVTAVTALEDPITQAAPAIEITPNGFTIDTVTALNTVRITLTA